MGMKHDLNINNVTVSRCETVDGNGDITVDATVHIYLDPVIPKQISVTGSFTADATVHIYLDPVIPKQLSWTGSFTAEFEDGECVTIKQNEL